MAMLSKHFQQAEAILVDQGELDQALAMIFSHFVSRILSYLLHPTDLHFWDSADDDCSHATAINWLSLRLHAFDRWVNPELAATGRRKNESSARAKSSFLLAFLSHLIHLHSCILIIAHICIFHRNRRNPLRPAVHHQIVPRSIWPSFCEVSFKFHNAFVWTQFAHIYILFSHRCSI